MKKIRNLESRQIPLLLFAMSSSGEESFHSAIAGSQSQTADFASADVSAREWRDLDFLFLFFFCGGGDFVDPVRS